MSDAARRAALGRQEFLRGDKTYAIEARSNSETAGPIWRSGLMSWSKAVALVAEIRRDGLWAGRGFGQTDNKPVPGGENVNVIPYALWIEEAE